MSDKERLIAAFDECLTAIADGAPVEETLERWPDLRPRLEPLVRQALDLQAVLDVPLPEGTAERVDRAIRLAAQSPSLRSRLRSAVAGLGIRPTLDGGLRRPSLAIAPAVLLVALLLGATVVLAAMSGPGDRLYPLKESVSALLGTAATDRTNARTSAGAPEGEARARGGPADSDGAPSPAVRVTPEPTRVTPRSGDAGAAAVAPTPTPQGGAIAMVPAQADTARGAGTAAAPLAASPEPTDDVPATLFPARPTDGDAKDEPISPTAEQPSEPAATSATAFTPLPTATETPTDTPTDPPSPVPTHTVAAATTVSPSATHTTSPPPSATPLPTPLPARAISGSVTDGAGEPLAGVEVVAYRLVGSPGEPPYALGDVFVRYTSATGTYRIHLEPGWYVVGAGAEPRSWWREKTAPEIADPLEVTLEGGVDGIDFRIDGG